jgi:cytochrome c oxidase subunit 2
MRRWILVIVAIICFAAASAVWEFGIHARGGTVWTCPTCGAQWYHGGGGAFQPVVPPRGNRGMMGGWYNRGMMGPGMMRQNGPAPFGVPQQSSYRSVGEQIYYTDTGSNGRSIPFSDGPPWLYMRGGSCVSCHGPDGRGGRPIPPTGIQAPDIRYAVLVGKEQPSAEAGHHHEHHYTDATIERAIIGGRDDDDKPLDRMMPRFEMSAHDADALIAYLKQLGAPR